jgi:hypothetical protein
MSRRRLNNPLDLTELEFKEISNKKLRKFKELAQKHNHIVVIGRNGAGKSTVLQDFKGINDEIAYISCARGQALHSECIIRSHDPMAMDEFFKKCTYSEGEYLFHTIKTRIGEALRDGCHTLILDEIDSGFSLDRLIMTFRGIKDFAPNIKLYIAINSFEALEAFRYFYNDCVIYNAETNKIIKCLDSYEAYTKEILSPIMKAFGKDLAFFKDFYNKRD